MQRFWKSRGGGRGQGWNKYSRDRDKSHDRKKHSRTGQLGVQFQTQLGNDRYQSQNNFDGNQYQQYQQNQQYQYQQDQIQQQNFSQVHQQLDNNKVDSGQFCGDEQFSLPPHFQQKPEYKTVENGKFLGKDQFLPPHFYQQPESNKKVVNGQGQYTLPPHLKNVQNQTQVSIENNNNQIYNNNNNNNNGNSNQFQLQLASLKTQLAFDIWLQQYQQNGVQIQNNQTFPQQSNQHNNFSQGTVFQTTYSNQFQIENLNNNNQNWNNYNQNLNNSQVFSNNQNPRPIFETVISNQPQIQLTLQQNINIQPNLPNQQFQLQHQQQLNFNQSNLQMQINSGNINNNSFYDSTLNLEKHIQNNIYSNENDKKRRKIDENNFQSGEFGESQNAHNVQKHHHKKVTKEIWTKNDKVVILFDLNGTLINRPKAKKGKQICVRPFIEQLLRLKDKFYLGIFSSAMHHTVHKVIDKIEDQLRKDGHLKKYEVLFQHRKLIKHRDDTCELDEDLRLKHEKPYGTRKPLAGLFEDLKRVILVDDDEYKSFPDERQNMLLLPSWDSKHVNAEKDTVLKVLVDQVLEKITRDVEDVRHVTGKISQVFFQQA